MLLTCMLPLGVEESLGREVGEEHSAYIWLMIDAESVIGAPMC